MDLFKLLKVPLLELFRRGYTEAQVDLLIKLARRLTGQHRL